MFFFLASFGLLAVGLVADLGMFGDEDETDDGIVDGSDNRTETLPLFTDISSNDATPGHLLEDPSFALVSNMTFDAESNSVALPPDQLALVEPDSADADLEGDSANCRDFGETAEINDCESSKLEIETVLVTTSDSETFETSGSYQKETDLSTVDRPIAGSDTNGYFILNGDGEDNLLSGVGAQSEEGSGTVKLTGSSAEAIYGEGGEDTILLGGNDNAYGGEGADLFIIDGDADSEEIPVISDFQVDLDVIEISLPSPEEQLALTYPEKPAFDGEICVIQRDGDTFIELNGEAVCRLVGSHEINETSIEVIYDHHGQLKTDFDLQYGY
ncbi:hypothetical protein [Aliiroseovarius sp. F47248L]|uniref:hypothetical protein n=1 Tax=Aliiroseovarius sp. F47248L TaxID=2926420 RepID=UPI001FF4E3A2|nr:hypothetical protein [Aliiroseovarius sp. F47248L]MCK0138106.1 hypothetical protein [Aliiroseovarius sp. F47248L]